MDPQYLLGMVAALGVLIMVHEYGHYRMAVACGVKVLRFSFGFGRVLLRHQKSPESTEFVLSALPLGGYVRMLGDHDPLADESDRHRTLGGRPLWQRALVVAAGPAANLLLAVLLFAAARGIGMREMAPILGTPPAASLMAEAGAAGGDRIVAVARGMPGEASDWQPVRSMNDVYEAVTQGVIEREPLALRLQRPDGTTTRDAALRLDRLPTRDLDRAAVQRIGLDVARDDTVLGAPDAGSPAERAGLREGDRVLNVDGVAVADGRRFVEHVHAAVKDGEGVPLHVVVARGGATVEVTVTPRVVEDAGQRIGRIGVPVGNPQMVTVRDTPGAALVEGARRTWATASETLATMRQMLVGHASLKNLSGPITVVNEAGKSAVRGFAYYLAFLATISVGLGVLNLLPLPILDGGTLMYYLFEGVTGRPVSEQWLARLQRGGLLILLLLMSLALSNDVARLLGLQ
jgi:regulator of sigma E protease